IDPPRIAGAKNRLDRARDEHTLFFQDAERAKLTDREYLLDIFDGLAQSSAGKDVFGPHNPLRALPNWLGPDAAGELLRFFQKIDSDSGLLVHDFTDPLQEDGSGWDTRFLGDLYQDLSEAARKKYALLQTPDFVEEFILDRTLEPALDEFGLQPETAENNLFKMIDPACGSGHFLLGSFPRILRRWQKEEPATNVRVLVQRTLDSIHGVDINPFAIAIARFRLLLAALAACGVKRLADAPAFAMNLACGDSLYHGVERQQTLGDWTDESHYFRTEDAEHLRSILQAGTFHAVVANPPYITPKDRAANQVYRRLYSRSCRGRYALSVPFIERIFGLGTKNAFTGQITSNSFMKAEFGKAVIEDFLPSIELTHVVDTSGAYIPGHGVPTVVLFGRTRPSSSNELRVLMGVRGEPGTPSDPSTARVWSEILRLLDSPGSDGEYVSVGESPRSLFHRHPWSIGGGGAAALKSVIDTSAASVLEQQCDSVGYMTITGEDSAYVATPATWRRSKVQWRPFFDGESVRDWSIVPESAIAYIYTSPPSPHSPVPLANLSGLGHVFWPARQTLRNRLFFGKTPEEAGRGWHEYGFISKERLRSEHSLFFAFIATHNHFVLHDQGTVVANRTAPLITLGDKTSSEIAALCGVLNSSVACFWMKQAGFNKGDSTDQHGARTIGDPAFNTYNFNSALLKKLPLPNLDTSRVTAQIIAIADEQKLNSLSRLNSPSKTAVNLLRRDRQGRTCEMVGLQEDLDWECYRLYGLLEDDLTYTTEESLGIQLGEKMARGEVQTTWFERHSSTPITELPDHWPDDYKQLVQRRIDVIESNPQIALIEQPEYKRRWNTTPWEEQVEKALKSWLLDRLESYFDFDGRMNDEGKTTAQIDISLISVAKLADIARQDEQFMEVAEVYRDDPAFDVQRLVEELVKGEHVPLLPVLRYKPSGLRKREQWEETWELQREEDRLNQVRSELRSRIAMRHEEHKIGKEETQARLRDEREALLSTCQSINETQLELVEFSDGDDIEAYCERVLAKGFDVQYAGLAMSVNDRQKAIKETKKQLRLEYQAACVADDELQAWERERQSLPAMPEIPVPPKYKSSDFISSGGARYWALRGKLDVPKERWISFPHCEGPDGTLMIAWAGYSHLQLATAIASYFVRVKEELGGALDPRLLPLLSCLSELLPWLKQWHNDIDPEFGMPMGDYFEGFLQEEARALQKTLEDIRAWQPPARKKTTTRKKATRKKAAKKKATS
ncbi:MAG: BREX-2 system adenine-specific DNA-methyltransferase PglX, partial [Planctomycetota bacterium]